MKLISFILVLNSITNFVNAQDLKAIQKNWSSEESDAEETTDIQTPAPIIAVKPAPPIKPQQVITPVKKRGNTPVFIEQGKGNTPISIKPASKSIITFDPKPASKPIITFDPKPASKLRLQAEPDEEIYEYSWSEESDEKTTKSTIITPKPKPVDPLSSEETSPVLTPIKTPFVPKSGPKVEVGTVLKPGGFNGLKPVLRPRQVQSIPYESWAESPLSMAPKKSKSG